MKKTSYRTFKENEIKGGGAFVKNDTATAAMNKSIMNWYKEYMEKDILEPSPSPLQQFLEGKKKEFVNPGFDWQEDFKVKLPDSYTVSSSTGMGYNAIYFDDLINNKERKKQMEKYAERIINWLVKRGNVDEDISVLKYKKLVKEISKVLEKDEDDEDED